MIDFKNLGFKPKSDFGVRAASSVMRSEEKKLNYGVKVGHYYGLINGKMVFFLNKTHDKAK